MLSNDLSILELEALVGPMEPIPCEHSQHITRPDMHSGDAIFYVQHHCSYCQGGYSAKAMCQPFIDRVNLNARMKCMFCSESSNALDVITILGPVNGTVA